MKDLRFMPHLEEPRLQVFKITGVKGSATIKKKRKTDKTFGPGIFKTLLSKSIS